jgi:hypothetical protein
MKDKSIDGLVNDDWPDYKFLDSIEDVWCLDHVHYVPGLVLHQTRLTKMVGIDVPKEGLPIPTAVALEWIKNKHALFGHGLYDYLVELYGNDYIKGKIR